MRFDEHFLRGALSDFTLLHDTFPNDATFCIDSRVLQPGDIFVALHGAHADGHAFVADAVKKGAGGFLISTDMQDVLKNMSNSILKARLVIAVPDVLQALTSLAAAWRAQFKYTVVAITGSVGKTSTKEIVAQILELNGGRFFASPGNQNTLIGLALNMLKMRDYHDSAVFEVGISKRGEMAGMANMLRPTTALITNIGHCHMEGLGSLSDIALEKRDVFKCFKEDSIGIINGDLPVLAGVGYPHPVIKFGSKTTNQIQARKINMSGEAIDFVLKIYKKKYAVRLTQTHSGAVFNVLAATSIAHFLGVSDDVIVEGIQKPVSVTSRFERCALKDNSGVMINDCYNANPESMKAALLAFEQMETTSKKIAVLGDMLELGVNSPFWHRQLGRFLRKVPSLKEVILVGNMVEWTQKTVPFNIKAELVPTWEDAAVKLKEKLSGDDAVLVKGSRALHLENIVQKFSKKRSKTETTS